MFSHKYAKKTENLKHYCNDTKTSKGPEYKIYFHNHVESGLNILPPKDSSAYEFLESKLTVN